MRYKDLTGKKFGKLFVIRYFSTDKMGNSLWLCKCTCGREIVTRGVNLSFRHSTGCVNCSNLKHGLIKTLEYKSWASMKQRCLNPKAPDYRLYGGRGITICQEWIENFEAFFKDMGKRPKGTSLDRIDTNGNYEPANCRWATPKEQQRGRRDRSFIPRFMESTGDG